MAALSVTQLSPEEEDAEQLSYRRVDFPSKRSAPLISKAEPDFILRTLVGAAVTLLLFICLAAWNGNRELGEIRTEARESREATDRRITALEYATDRRITALEQRVWGQ